MNINRPHIVARKSILPAFKLWRILTFWLIVPLIMIIVDVVILRSQYVEFYDSFVIKKRGVFNKTEERCMFPKILSCHVYRSFWGRVFNYGDIKVDAIGKWDVDLEGIKRPLFVRKYLENHFISAKEIRAMRQTVVTQ
jgi:hypothetical protein